MVCPRLDINDVIFRVFSVEMQPLYLLYKQGNELHLLVMLTSCVGITSGFIAIMELHSPTI